MQKIYIIIMSYSKMILLNGLGHVCEFTILYCRLLVEALDLKGTIFFYSDT